VVAVMMKSVPEPVVISLAAAMTTGPPTASNLIAIPLLVAPSAVAGNDSAAGVGENPAFAGKPGAGENSTLGMRDVPVTETA
jgi:hypothetical protein